jgi:hypothetical protein
VSFFYTYYSSLELRSSLAGPEYGNSNCTLIAPN